MASQTEENYLKSLYILASSTNKVNATELSSFLKREVTHCKQYGKKPQETGIGELRKIQANFVDDQRKENCGTGNSKAPAD